jgi:hypothetical protein
MKKILLMLLLLALVSGCIPSGPSQDTYRKGTQAIALSFVENAPPSSVFDTDHFIIGVKAQNMGAESTNVNFHLGGYDRNIINIGGAGSVRLAGKVEVYNPREGETNTVTFKQSSTNQAQVCINGNPSFNKGVCTVSDVSLGGGQGGPVGVTKIEVAATPGKTNFRIHVKNFGPGGPCKNGQASELERVTVESVKVHNKALSCKPLDGGALRLIDGAGTLYCDMGVGLNDIYPTPLTVTLSYGYSTTITRSVEIVKAPR